MRFEEALRDLDARQPERMVPDLTRIAALAELLDHPERTSPTVHVTGTNGKTTTARVVARILCGHGLAAGLYTSPHLESVTERLAVCDDRIGEAEFAVEYERLSPYLAEVDRRGERVTYFETLTALAYLWFADKPVDVAVYEVGMGGVWDATNLVRGEVAVLCPIALDHPELGSTIPEVATEKAGIIKEGSVAIVREQVPEALAVIEARAAETGADLRLEGREFALEDRAVAVGGQQLTVRGLRRTYDDLFLPIHGPHQARNAAAAVAASEALLRGPLGEESLREALAGATSPGRLEVAGHRPLVVLDGAHNPEAARALVAALADAFVWRRLHLVIGVLADKDAAGILDHLAAVSERAFVARPRSPRALDPDLLARECERAGIPATVFSSIGEAADTAIQAAAADDLVLVTGSLYTVAEARARLVTLRSSPH